MLSLLLCPVAAVVAEADPVDPATATSQLAWSDSFGSHMVLQQLPSPTVLWGFASPGTTVNVQRLRGSAGTPPVSAVNTTASDGVWWVQMQGRPAGNESFTFMASARGKASVAAGMVHSQILMEDVVYGDVWVCSGAIYR